MTAVLVLGLLLNLIALPIAAHRVWFLERLITSGQPAPDRVEGVTQRLGLAVKTQAVEVLGQKKLLKWSVPGAAHFFVFWAFVILATVYLEAYGALIALAFGADQLGWAIPVVGNWAVLGFVQDYIAVMALAGIDVGLDPAPQRPEAAGQAQSASRLPPVGRVLHAVHDLQRHVDHVPVPGAVVRAGDLPYGKAAFISICSAILLDGLSHSALEVLEGIGLLLHIGVMLAFLIFVLNSKHLHIFVAPLNVLFGRRPVALGAVQPLISAGKPVTLDDIDDLDEDARLGVGSIQDFTWKGLLDFSTCTECGRCQSQCPAWNTEKPLSPKLLIMNLRDHAMAAAPATLAGEGGSPPEAARKEAERPLIGDESVYGVIDPDVLWSCTSCGACVNECPVDIEHVDHIIDMRRYQVLVENNFPAELNQLFKGLEGRGNPWNLSASARMDWAKGLDFDVPVVGEDLESMESVDWLFWVGCAGAYEDRAKKTTRAVAELLNLAGISFGVLGNGETCTGDPARRAGNEFIYQGLAQQNVETLTEHKVKQVVTTCAHCSNTLKNEYRDFGLELEVVHHTQLLNRLVREGKLTPVASGAGAAKRTITYHDPCYLGRHNQVYEPPRELLQVLPGASYVEMERSGERSFCCGAGGARMWMEESVGERINVNRTKEAVGTGADQIAVGCPFCRVMLSDGLTSEQAQGQAREEVEVLDVAQMLLASVSPPPRAGRTESAAAATSAAGAEPEARSEETRAEPEPGDDTQTEDTVTETADVGPAAKASGGSSLFDVAADDESPGPPRPTRPSPPAPRCPRADRSSTSPPPRRRSSPRPRRRLRRSPSPRAELAEDCALAEPETPAETRRQTPEPPAAEVPPGGCRSSTDRCPRADRRWGGSSATGWRKNLLRRARATTDRPVRTSAPWRPRPQPPTSRRNPRPPSSPARNPSSSPRTSRTSRTSRNPHPRPTRTSRRRASTSPRAARCSTSDGP